MKEKRQFKRFFIEGKDVINQVDFSTEVNLLDISMGGAAISLSRKLHIGEQYNFKLQDDTGDFFIRGEAVWEDLDFATAGADPAEPEYRVGIAFSEVYTKKGDELAAFIRGWSRTGASKTRVCGTRLKLSNTKGKLDCSGEYKVDEVSFGGLRFETDSMMEVDAELPMKLCIPGAPDPVCFVGKIASCRRVDGTEHSRYKVGVEFIEMRFKDLNLIKELIAEGVPH